MVYHLVIASLGIAALAGAWVAVQALVRRSSPEYAPETDVLACRTCGTEGACGGCGHLPGRAADADETPNNRST